LRVSASNTWFRCRRTRPWTLSPPR
jgi:hypothetical protein